MTVSSAKRAQIDGNFKALQAKMDQYMKLHPGKFALMRDGEVVEFYLSWEDAYRTGLKFYEDGLFSVQQVDRTPLDLGYFSHAVHLG